MTYMMVYSSLFFMKSFRFFFWLMMVELAMVWLILKSMNFDEFSNKVFTCILLVLGACEVGAALSLMVKVSRFKGVEKIDMLQCEGY